jgi:hypothetical protein
VRLSPAESVPVKSKSPEARLSIDAGVEVRLTLGGVKFVTHATLWVEDNAPLGSIAITEN